MRRRKQFVAAMAMLAMCLTSFAGFAGEPSGDWRPESAINIRVPFAAGGSLDTITRIIGQGLQETYNQTVIVNNKTGANGAIAANDVLSLKPDAREMVTGGISLFTLAPLFNREINVNLDDFEMICALVSEDFLLFVAPGNSGLKTFEDLMNHGKTNRVLFGSNNPGGTTHMLATALFGEAGVNARAVTSPGSAQDLLALVGDNVVCAVATAQVARQYVEEGSIVPVLVFSDEEFTGYPGHTVPTAKGKGYDIVFRSCNFLMTKKGVDKKVVDQIYKDILAFYETDRFKTLAANANYEPDTSDGETVRQVIKDAAATCQTIYDKYYKR